MSRHRTPGRRRAPGAVRRLPDGFRRIGTTYAVKTVAGIAVLGGAATMLALPVGADPTSSLALASPAATSVDGRDGAAALTASRSQGREAPEPAVSAPAGAAPVAPDQVGVTGVRAVAKPTPKPTPRASATKEGSSEESQSASSARSTYSGGISSYCAGLGVDRNAAILCSAIRAQFDLPSIGGFRAGAGEHGTGEAMDLMVRNKDQGDALAAWIIANAGTYDVEYLIWYQRYRPIPGSWEPMEDRGSTTQNHMDHVHVTVR